jgi:hypothetical protein
MGAIGAMNRRLKRPDDPRNKKLANKVGLGSGVFEQDSVGELMDARRGYVKRTGRNDLKPVEQAGLFKTLTEKQKKRYYELNPSERPKVDEDENFTLGKKTLLGN